VLIHAGVDKSAGGAEGPFALWAHSSAVPSGYTVPGTKVKVFNYILQPEDAGVGVFAREHGRPRPARPLRHLGTGRLRRGFLG